MKNGFPRRPLWGSGRPTSSFVGQWTSSRAGSRRGRPRVRMSPPWAFLTEKERCKGNPLSGRAISVVSSGIHILSLFLTSQRSYVHVADAETSLSGWNPSEVKNRVFGSRIVEKRRE